jgi:hypothetical protein
MSDLEPSPNLSATSMTLRSTNLWPGVFTDACNFIGASAAALLSHDIVQRRTTVFYNWGFTPGYEKTYVESGC